MGYYCEAISEIECGSVPLLGPSVDRRSFQHVAEVYNDESVQCLVCFVCACKKTTMCATNQDIEYRSGSWFSSLSADSLRLNLHFVTFKDRYASQEPLLDAPALADGTDEWRRTLRFSASSSMEVICSCFFIRKN